MLVDARDVELFGDRSGGEYQLVPFEGRLTVGAGHRQFARLEIDGRDVPEQQPGPWQGLPGRDGDVPRIEDAGSDLGQQRTVEQVVGGGYQRQYGAIRTEQLRKPLQGVESAETTTDHHDPSRPRGDRSILTETRKESAHIRD